MVSNRISHFFDLSGSSVTVDTGCSTGLTALHMGCQSIRTGESKMSIVGGANIMLNPDMFISMSSIGSVATCFPQYRSQTNKDSVSSGRMGNPTHLITAQMGMEEVKASQL